MPPGRPRIFVRIRSASASPTRVYNTHRKPMNSTIMATTGTAWSSRNVQSSPGGGGVGGPCSIVTLYASRSLRVSAASAGRPEPLALAILREEPLGKIYAFREFRHLPPQLLQRRRNLFLPRLVRGARLAPRLQLGSVRFREGPDDHQGEKPADGDDGDEDSHGVGVHQLLGGASRSPSRCLASSRSAKSIRSLNSLTSVRSWCTSPVSSERSSSSSPRTSAGSAPPPGRRMRSAIALPTGEIASRNSVPPPKIKTMARAPVMSMIGSYRASRLPPAPCAGTGP